jgi:hypothetical protein
LSRQLAVAGLLVCALAVLAAVGAGGALAATTVNCAPFGSDNLQAAITAAAPGSTLLIKGRCAGNFTVPKNLTLTGSPTATLDGVGSGRTVTVAGGVVVTMNNLTITGGNVSGAGPAGAGGGILSLTATLTLNHCLVTGNTASSAGGGIVSGSLGPVQAGLLTLNSTSVTNNVAVGNGGGGGGGILNHNGTAILNNSTVRGNSGPGGGGIASGNGNGGVGGGGVVTITGSSISGNTATAGPQGGAGGIANGGTLTLTNSSVTGNQAVGGIGGGILNHGVATISGSQISGNAAPDDSLGDQGIGGGIANVNFGVDGSGLLSITGGQVTRNSSDLGGGIANVAFGGDTTATVSGTMVAFNTVSGQQSGGGGIVNASGNDDSGDGNAELTISGSVLVGNLARQGLGGAIGNLSLGGSADVSIGGTVIGSTSLSKPYTLNPNQALFGGGIFNGQMGGPASVSLGPGSAVVGNQALVDGGGIFNADDATFTNIGAIVMLNHPDNIVIDPTFF